MTSKRSLILAIIIAGIYFIFISKKQEFSKSPRLAESSPTIALKDIPAKKNEIKVIEKIKNIATTEEVNDDNSYDENCIIRLKGQIQTNNFVDENIKDLSKVVGPWYF